MKRAKIVAIVSTALAGVATLSIGFASWIISGSAQQQATGNVTADAVAENNITISTSFDGGNSISFGAPQDANSGWLTGDGNGTTESLSVTIILTIDGNAGDIQFSMASGSGEFSNGSYAQKTTNLATAQSRGYISPTVSYSVESDDYSYDSGNTITRQGGSSGSLSQATVRFTATFAWGTHFGGSPSNPYNYYNGLDYSATVSNGYTWDAENSALQGVYNDGDMSGSPTTGEVAANVDALASLNDLYQLVNGLNFNFTFSAKAKTD